MVSRRRASSYRLEIGAQQWREWALGMGQVANRNKAFGKVVVEISGEARCSMIEGDKEQVRLLQLTHLLQPQAPHPVWLYQACFISSVLVID